MRDIFFASCTKICYPERADCRFGWEGRSHGPRLGGNAPRNHDRKVGNAAMRRRLWKFWLIF